ncbi:MAG: flagellar biosynthetic protein FliO [Tepidisphaeraceae bacterium]
MPPSVILLVAALPWVQGASPATQPASRPAIAALSDFDGVPTNFHRGDAARGASAKNEKQAADTSFGYTRWVLSLGAVLGLIFAAKYAGQRLMGLQPHAGAGAISVLCRQSLAPRQQLMLVQVGRRVVLVAATGAQMNTLAEISDPDEIAEIVAQAGKRRLAAAASFGSMFGRAADAYEAPLEESQTPPPPEEASAGAELSAARNELSNLLQKVRLVSSVAKRP